MKTLKHTASHALIGGLIVAVLTITFALYLRPEFIISLSQQLWFCN